MLNRIYKINKTNIYFFEKIWYNKKKQTRKKLLKVLNDINVFMKKKYINKEIKKMKRVKKEILKNTIEELKSKYPNLEILHSYNKALEVDELIIKDEKLKYSSNFEFDDFLYDVLDKNVYSKNLDIYCYYVLEDEFEKIKKKKGADKNWTAMKIIYKY